MRLNLIDALKYQYENWPHPRIRMGKGRQQLAEFCAHMELKSRKLSTNGDQKEDKRSCLTDKPFIAITALLHTLWSWTSQLSGHKFSTSPRKSAKTNFVHFACSRANYLMLATPLHLRICIHSFCYWPCSLPNPIFQCCMQKNSKGGIGLGMRLLNFAIAVFVELHCQWFI